MGWRKKMGVPDTPENNFAYFADIAYGIENLKTSSENHIKLPQYSRKVKNNNKNKVLNIYYRDVTQNTQNSKPDNSPKKAHSEPLTQNTQNTQNSSKNQILRKSPAKKQRCLHNRFCFFLTPGDQ